MPSSWATSGTSSTSSLTKWAPVNCSENLISYCYYLRSCWGGEGSGSVRKGIWRTYFTTCGAMTLQGPHQVAKASRMTILLSLRADWNSALLFIITLASLHQLRDYHVLNASEKQLAQDQWGGKTYLDKLWTPILTADCLNPLAILL
jgi:hypothetical protein